MTPIPTEKKKELEAMALKLRYKLLEMIGVGKDIANAKKDSPPDQTTSRS